MKVVTKKNTYLLLLLVISLLGVALSTTYAKFPSSYVTGDDIVGMSLDFNIGITNIEEYEELEVAMGKTLTFNVEIENVTSNTMYYGIWYKMVIPSEITSDISIGRLEGTEITTSDSIDANGSKTVTIGIINNSDSDIKINIGVGSSTTSTSDIEYLNGRNLITGTVKINTNMLLSEYVQNLYNDGSSLTTVNIGGDTSNPSVSLNATQGIMLDNNGEYRYYGLSPNNYVSFNGELWRIISVSNVKSNESDTEGEMRVKIISDKSIGNYSWDSSDSSINSGFGVNDWTQADLMTELNTLYYNKKSGSCYNGQSNLSTTCDFTSIGLDNESKDMIDNALWYLSGSDGSQPYQAYNKERGTYVYGCSTDDGACPRATSWTGKIGLIYPSDYGYATDLSICTVALMSYNAECVNNNWMFSSINDQWLLSPTSGDPYSAFSILSSGQVYGSYLYNIKMVRPALYLKSDVMISGGTGTKGNPYQLEIKLEPNAPNLDDGNLIPVYYDNETEVWKKADSNNTDNSWYDYDNKMWANAILISDSTKRSTYQSASVGTTITDSDITAFYVWIPRFKYRVWNITRQAGDESTYAYSAYSKGIDIVWENNINSTGNIECTYDTATVESETNLSDTCIYNETDTITTTSGNSNYTDAWYTHPAFTFGDEEVTGFWIGKFETTGTAEAPTVLPDLISLGSQIVSEQFNTSKIFQTYGLSNNIDTHMLTNLEWGAVAYLTHSIYGLCDETNCRDAYINNSSEYYTGRSGGAITGSDELELTNVYGDDITIDDTLSTTLASSTGYYTYKGYFIDYSGNITNTKDISKVASTTGNVTGVYDMVGGANDNVMGNMVDSSNNFYSASAGNDWNGSSVLESKYYNSYSYGTNDVDAIAFNRARLGDATAEVIGGTFGYYSTWKPGAGISGTYSGFVSHMDNNMNFWFNRGGFGWGVYSGIFNFGLNDGNLNYEYTFRSSLS